MNTNPTIGAIRTLLRRGWAGRSAFAYVCRLFEAQDFGAIRRLAHDQRGAVAVEFALIMAAVIMPAMAGATLLAGEVHAYADRLSALVQEAKDACAALPGCIPAGEGE